MTKLELIMFVVLGYPILTNTTPYNTVRILCLNIGGILNLESQY